MEKFILVARLCEAEARRMDVEIETEIQPVIENAHEEMKTYRHESEDSALSLDETLLAKQDMDSRTAGAYVLFENTVKIINVADLEEVVAWQKEKEKPDYSVLLSFFIYGLMFDVLNRKKWLNPTESAAAMAGSSRRVRARLFLFVTSSLCVPSLSHMCYREASTF
jgi:hypothetical protein